MSGVIVNSDKPLINRFSWLLIITLVSAFVPLYFAGWYLILFSGGSSGNLFKDYYALFTTTLSALGGIGAAAAAFFSLRAAKQSNEISLKNIELVNSSYLDVEYKLNRVVDPEPSIRLVCCGPGPSIIKKLYIIYESERYEWSSLEAVIRLSEKATFAIDGLGFSMFNSPMNLLAPNHSIDLVLYSWPEVGTFQYDSKHADIENFFGRIEVEVEYEDVLGNKKSFIKYPPFKLGSEIERR